MELKLTPVSYTHLDVYKRQDYERANNAKERYVRALYAAHKHELKDNAEYNGFVDSNKSWLMPYAAWCVLRDKMKTSDIRQWGEYSQYHHSSIAKFINDNFDEVQYHCYVQYLSLIHI